MTGSRLLPVVLLALLFSRPAAAEQGGSSNPRPARMNVMGSQSMFATVNRNDATASLKVWIDALGRRRVFAFQSRLELVSGPQDLLSRLRAQTVDMMILDTPDYLELEGSKLIEAVGVGTHKGKVAAFRYLLLSRQGATDPAKGGLADLRGKRVVVSSRTQSDMGMAWLEVLLADQQLGRAGQYFASVTPTYRPSSCVLPLFFGRIDACVVDASSWELMQELNPQLAKLQVLAQSEPLLEGMVAMPVQPHPYRGEIIESVMDLHRDPAGAQMVMLFKIGSMVRPQAGVFDAVRTLWSRYQKLNGGSGKPMVVSKSAPGNRAGEAIQ
jgi:phosphonate transport system substrate-binding protein